MTYHHLSSIIESRSKIFMRLSTPRHMEVKWETHPALAKEEAIWSITSSSRCYRTLTTFRTKLLTRSYLILPCKMRTQWITRHFSQKELRITSLALMITMTIWRITARWTSLLPLRESIRFRVSLHLNLTLKTIKGKRNRNLISSYWLTLKSPGSNQGIKRMHLI